MKEPTFTLRAARHGDSDALRYLASNRMCEANRIKSRAAMDEARAVLALAERMDAWRREKAAGPRWSLPAWVTARLAFSLLGAIAVLWLAILARA